MVIRRAVVRVCHVTKGDVPQILNFISQITLGISRILLVYGKLFKTYGFIYVIVYDISMIFVLASAMTLTFA